MHFIKSIKSWADKNNNVGLELIRIYLGIGLLAKGVHFVISSEFLIGLLVDAGHLDFANTMITHLVGIGHIGGGALVTVGLITRVGAMIQIPILIGALYYVSLGEGIFTQSQSFEFTALVLFLLVTFSIFGGGKWSIDRTVLQK